MHRYPKMLLPTAILVVAGSISMAQEPYHSPDPDVMARLSYGNSGVFQQWSVHRVCIAVSRDGEYRTERWTDEERSERRHGKMTKEELSQLSKLRSEGVPRLDWVSRWAGQSRRQNIWRRDSGT